MKAKLDFLFIAFALFAVAGVTHAATITWTNTNGGDWNVATNWSPNQVPENGDDVIITNSGSYAVTNAPSVTLDNLILGGTNGTQTLTISSLTLTNIGLVNSNGVLNWGGGDLEGSLTILQGGTLSISNTVYFDETSPYNNNAALTNYGTVVCVGNIASFANEGSLGGTATIDNAGLWESVADNTIQVEATSTNLFINTGTLEKIGGTGISYIYWNFTNRFGILDAQTNTLSLAGNYDLTGGTLNVGINSLANNGVINLSGSPATLTGTLSANFNAGFLPAVNNSWQIINYTTSSGVFSQTNLPPIAVWQVMGNATSLTIKVLRLVPQMSWPSPSDIVYGTALSSSQLDATASWNSSPVSGSFIYNPPLGTVLQSGSNQTLSVTFMPSDTATYINVTTNVVINVLKAPLGVTANNQSKTYGQNFTFAGTEFVPSGLVNGDTVTSVSLASAGAVSNAPVSGSPYAITINNALGDAGLTNYIITYTNGLLTVNKAPLGITANNRLKTYGQTVIFAGTEFTPSGLQNSETVGSITLTSAGAGGTASVAGSPYSIVPSAATGGTFAPGNYAITYTNGTLMVGPAPLGITANTRIKTYGQNVAFAGTEFVSSPLQNAETIGTVTLTSAGAISNAPVSGSPYSIVPSAATGGTFTPGNYAIVYTNGTLTVNRAGLTVTANNAARTYGAANPAFSVSYSGFVNNETVSVVSGVPGFSTPATVTSGIGGYAITPLLGTLTAANYSFGPFNNGTLTINPAALGITASNLSKTYGQNVTFAGTEFAANGLLNSDTVTHVTLTSAGAISNAPVSGSPYSIVPSAATGSGLTNYTIAYTNGVLTVNKALLGITANSRGKTYGQNINFAGTEFVSSPLQNAETIGTVTLTSAGAISNAPVSGSPYSIVPSAATGGTFAPGNYAITYTNGALTISPASLGITANNRGKTYGQTVTFAGTEFTPVGLQNSETVGSVTLTSPGAVATASVAGSPYNITPSAATGGTFTPGNYTIGYTNGALSVNKATLTITANSTNKIVGETLTFAGTEFTASGLQNSETIGTVTLTSAGAVSTAAAGPYNIVPSAPIGGTFSQGNYSDIFVDGTLTVSGAPELTLTALGNQYVLTFQSVSGQIYQLQSKTNLSLAAWSSLGGTINGTGGTVNVTNALAGPQSFFHLEIMP
jgi:hypothetical protein